MNKKTEKKNLKCKYKFKIGDHAFVCDNSYITVGDSIYNRGVLDTIMDDNGIYDLYGHEVVVESLGKEVKVRWMLGHDSGEMMNVVKDIKSGKTYTVLTSALRIEEQFRLHELNYKILDESQHEAWMD